MRRDTPFGVSPKDSKRALYEIAVPFLRFWVRFVEPNRSRLEAGQVSDVAEEVRRRSSQHTSEIWEDLARLSVPRLPFRGRSWRPASRWWGPGLDRKPMEIDIVAESTDGRALLLGEARWSEESSDRLLRELAGKAERFPERRGRGVVLALWLKGERRRAESGTVLTPESVLRALL